MIHISAGNQARASAIAAEYGLARHEWTYVFMEEQLRGARDCHLWYDESLFSKDDGHDILDAAVAYGLDVQMRPV